MLKILQANLQQYVNQEFPDVQAGFRKGRGTRDQIANIHWIMEKAREFQKKHLTDLINHTGVVTHLELDILEYEVKWALSGKIPAELFQILKDDVVKVLHSICQQI